MRQASGSYCRIRVDLCSKIVPLKIYNAKEFSHRFPTLLLPQPTLFDVFRAIFDSLDGFRSTKNELSTPCYLLSFRLDRMIIFIVSNHWGRPRLPVSGRGQGGTGPSIRIQAGMAYFGKYKTSRAGNSACNPVFVNAYVFTLRQLLSDLHIPSYRSVV